MNLFIKVFTLFILLVFSHIAYAQELKDSIGNASFYADKFNGRKTASGEKFDNSKFTAAHRTLPFQTLLLVSNPKNGKEVVVKVNDRGPHVKNRIIDLSKAAASELDIVRAGVAKVHIRIIDSGYFQSKPLDSLSKAIALQEIQTDSLSAKDSIISIEKKWFYGVQVGSFREMENVEKTRQMISAITTEKIFVFTYSKEGTDLHQIIVGDFINSKKSTILRKKLLPTFKDAFITHYQN